MKQLIWIIAGVIMIAGVSALVLRQATGNAHLRDIGIVTAITLISAQIAMVPLLMARGKAAVAMFQSAFVGTVIHLFLMLVMGAVIHMMNWVDRKIFMFLLLSFYSFSLVFVVIAIIRIFRICLHPPSTGRASNS